MPCISPSIYNTLLHYDDSSLLHCYAVESLTTAMLWQLLRTIVLLRCGGSIIRLHMVVVHHYIATLWLYLNITLLHLLLHCYTAVIACCYIAMLW